jgi:hypothetical protein
MLSLKVGLLGCNSASKAVDMGLSSDFPIADHHLWGQVHNTIILGVSDCCFIHLAEKASQIF